MLPGIAVCRDDSYWRSKVSQNLRCREGSPRCRSGANGPKQACARAKAKQLVTLIFGNIFLNPCPLVAVAGRMTA